MQFLSEELKQSYTTKNFTLKSGLLDLEKQYRAHMNVDPAMAAFWADVTVLLVSRPEWCSDTPAAVARWHAELDWVPRLSDTAARICALDGCPCCGPVSWKKRSAAHRSACPEGHQLPPVCLDANLVCVSNMSYCCCLQDENRDKDAPLQFKGPSGPADSDSTPHRTPRQSTGSQLDAAAAAQGSSSAAGDATAQQHSSGSRNCSSGGSRIPADSSTILQQQQQGVQLQVKSFNTIISEEEASAASILQDKDKPPGQGSAGVAAGEVVVRQGAGFRVIRASQPDELAAAAAGGPGSSGGSVVEEPLQPVAVLKDSYASRLKVGQV
jgi:hypothetical protein